MFKINSKKPLVTAVTTVLTTSVLLACTPSQRQEQSQVEPVLLPVGNIEAVEEDREVKISVGKLPQAVVHERLRKQETRMEQSVVPSTAQPVVHGGRTLLADQA